MGPVMVSLKGGKGTRNLGKGLVLDKFREKIRISRAEFIGKKRQIQKKKGG